MLLILGDSNFRNALETFGEALSAKIGEELKFFMASSNETIKIHLNNKDLHPKIVVIGTPLNEIVHKYNANKKTGRAETIKEVLEEQNKIVTEAAQLNPNTLYLMVPPFMRGDPQWIKDRLSLAVFHVKDFVGDNGPWNVAVANPIKILEEDLLSDDKVHLNHTGKEKLYRSLEHDLITCKANLGEGVESQDWASQLASSEPPTPATLRKRQREEPEVNMEEEEEDAPCGAKKGRFETVLDKIDLLMKEIKEERTGNKVEISNIKTKVDENEKKVGEVEKSVAGIEKTLEKDNILYAEMKEDMDGLENENLKTTIIVRKLKAEGVPKEKKALRAYVQTQARELVTKFTDTETTKCVKFAAPLYNFIDPSKKDNKEGYIPPFKIGFSSKDAAVRFRDAAVKKAKEDGSEYKDTYFTFYQSVGTKVRCMLMWSVCDIIKTENREAWVNQQVPKPTLQIKEGGKIVKSLSFVKTIEEYKEKIPEKAIEEATKVAKKHYYGKLEKTFIVLKDK